MVKVFTVNKDGKITFTKEELEKVLNEAWNDGYNSNYYHSYWWSSPTIRTGSLTTSADIDTNIGSYSTSTTADT